MDFSQLWEQGTKSVENSWDQFVKTGVPALQAGLEQNAIDWLTAQKAETQQTLQTNIKEMLKDPNPSTGIAKALKDAGTSAGLQTYGLYIIGAVGLLLVVGMKLK